MSIDIKYPCIASFISRPGGGKSTTIRYLAKKALDNNEINYIIVICNEAYEPIYKKWIPNNYIYPYYSKLLIKRIMARQVKYDKSGDPKKLLLILDDVAGFSNEFETPLFESLFSIHRHYNISLFISFQYIKMVHSPALRTSQTCGFIYKLEDKAEFEGAYESFGQRYTFKKFKEIINNVTSSNNTILYCNKNSEQYIYKVRHKEPDFEMVEYTVYPKTLAIDRNPKFFNNKKKQEFEELAELEESDEDETQSQPDDKDDVLAKTVNPNKKKKERLVREYLRYYKIYPDLFPEFVHHELYDKTEEELSNHINNVKYKASNILNDELYHRSVSSVLVVLEDIMKGHSWKVDGLAANILNNPDLMSEIDDLYDSFMPSIVNTINGNSKYGTVAKLLQMIVGLHNHNKSQEGKIFTPPQNFDM